MFCLEREKSSVSKPSPDEVARTAFHSLKLLNADAGIEYARIGVSSGSQLSRFRNEIWRPALLFPKITLSSSKWTPTVIVTRLAGRLGFLSFSCQTWATKGRTPSFSSVAYSAFAAAFRDRHDLSSQAQAL
jgi:hypothetical protein